MSSRVRKSTKTFWARLAVNYYRDAKILKVGPIGEVAFLRLLALARETVESSHVLGGVEKIVALRELIDLNEIWVKLYGENSDPGNAILEKLASVGLIQIDGDNIIISAYSEWQTTQEEIQDVREQSRERQEARRRRHEVGDGVEAANDDKEVNSDSKTSKKKGEDTVGVYDDKVEAFEDLRISGGVKKGKTKIGKHGLDPKYTNDVEKLVQYYSESRKKHLGSNFRITDSWYGDCQKLLKGSGDSDGLTLAQVCDLIDFALTDSFWLTHTQVPAGLVKHGMKLYLSDTFVAWSKRNHRPEVNRPRNNFAGGANRPSKGDLAADRKTDWSETSEQF